MHHGNNLAEEADAAAAMDAKPEAKSARALAGEVAQLVRVCDVQFGVFCRQSFVLCEAVAQLGANVPLESWVRRCVGRVGWEAVP